MRGIVQRVIAGRWADAELEPPALYPYDRVELVRRTYAKSCVEWPCRPRELATALGVRLVPTSARLGLCGGEAATSDVVLVRYHTDRLELALRQWHGLAHALLARESWRAMEADVWLVTLELALPWREARRNRHQEAALPSWAIREWVNAATQLGARDAA